MKRFLLMLICIVLSFYYCYSQTTTQIWSDSDRQDLILGLKTTQNEILIQSANLSDLQIYFKPDSTQWSIAEVLEHLGVYEELLYWDLMNNQYTEERPDLLEKVKGIDSLMSAYATDPNKGQAPFIAQPIGRFHGKEQLLSFFNKF